MAWLWATAYRNQGQALVSGFGILVAIVGILLYLFRNDLAETMRFLLPIPPLSVAAYVFILNVFRNFLL